MTPAQRLDAKFSALADPTRRAILARLAQGEATVMELVEPFNMSQPAISKHLKVLERAGLIATGHEAQRRPRKLQGQAMQEPIEWLEQCRKVWEANYARLDDLLEELKATDSAPKKKKVRVTRGGGSSPSVRPRANAPVRKKQRNTKE